MVEITYAHYAAPLYLKHILLNGEKWKEEKNEIVTFIIY